MADRPFRIYKGQQARPITERARSAPGVAPPPVPETVARGLKLLTEAGWTNGAQANVLISTPTLHITHVWFKSGFPLPLHSHDADCFYHIIGGSARVGTETLEPGDGFFVPANAAYTLVPGEQGVELYEIRQQDWFDTHYRTSNPDYWTRTAEVVKGLQDRWANEPPPVGAVPGAGAG
jgi:hypothetical protein